MDIPESQTRRAGCPGFEPLMVYQRETGYQKRYSVFSCKNCQGFEPNVHFVHSDSLRSLLSVLSNESPYGSSARKAKGNESPVETHCPSTAEPSAGRQTAKQAVKVPCGFSRRTKGGAGKCDSEKNPANGAG